MQVILKTDIPSVGRIGEICDVKAGFARNYLIPKGFAVSASTGSLKSLEHQKRLVEVHKQAIKKESDTQAEKIKGTAIKVKRRVNSSGVMYGSVLPQDVSKELKKANFDIDRRDVDMEPISEAGEFEIKVRLPGDVFSTIQLTVEAQVEKETTKKKAKPKAKPKEEAASASETEATFSGEDKTED